MTRQSNQSCNIYKYVCEVETYTYLEQNLGMFIQSFRNKQKTKKIPKNEDVVGKNQLR